MIQVATKPDETIWNLYPSWRDDRFKHLQTVYLAEGYTLEGKYVNDVMYSYSDRLRYSVDWNAYEKAWGKARFQHGGRIETAEAVTTYLRLLLNEPTLQVVHIQACTNWSNGHDVQLFGYIIGDKS